MCVLCSPSVFLPWNLSQHCFQRVAVQNLSYTRRHHLTCTQKGGGGRGGGQRQLADRVSDPSCPLLGEPVEAENPECMIDAQSEQHIEQASKER